MRKKEKGITLIALVVTIVVLLILAGVSISMLMGENGIINQAKIAKEQTDIANERERVQLAATAAMGKEEYGIITRDKLKVELDINIGTEGKDYSLEGTDPFKVTYLETQRSYYVDSNGNVIESGGENEYIPTNPNYFTYELNEDTKEAMLTGIKDEYMLKSYYKYAESYYYPIAIIDGENKITDVKIPDKITQNGTTYTVIAIEDRAFAIIENMDEVNNYDKESEFTSFYIPNTVQGIGENTFKGCVKLKTITIDNTIERVYGKEPWGAEENTEIIYLGELKYKEFATKYLSNKSQEELEELILKSALYVGTFEEFLNENDMTRADIEQKAEEKGMTYIEYIKDLLINAEVSWVRVEYEVSKNNAENKTLEELRKMLAQKVAGTDSFEDLLEQAGLTQEEYENMIKETQFHVKNSI